MKYCYNCGTPMEDYMLFCHKCGTKVAEEPSSDPEYAHEEQQVFAQGYDQIDAQAASRITINKPRKSMKVLEFICLAFAGIYALMSIMTPVILGGTAFFGILAVMFFVLAKSPKGTPFLFGKTAGLKKSIFAIICVSVAFAAFAIVGGVADNAASQNYGEKENAQPSPSAQSEVDVAEDVPSKQQDIIVDVTQYANISGKELIALLGEPDSIEEGTCTGVYEVPCIYYDYSSAEAMGDVSFVLVNDSVIRFSSYSEYPYADGEDNLACFGIEKGYNCTKIADTEMALRYRCPSDQVDDFWIGLIEGGTFESLQVTFDMLYYEEWYLPVSFSDMTTYPYWAQETVKQLLKAPSTAEFPDFNNWSVSKNPFYIAVQSYVDAQNSFGAQIRSEFTFIYYVGTSDIAYAVFDSEVIADNGYVPMADLISQLVSEDAQSQ